MKLRYKYLKAKLFFRQLATKKIDLTPNEILIKQTVIKLLADNKNNIYVFPLSNTIYIQTEDQEYTIILSENKIKITNHKLFIETYINDQLGKKLQNLVYKCLDKRKKQMDELIFENELDGLNYVLNSLKNEKTTTLRDNKK